MRNIVTLGIILSGSLLWGQEADFLPLKSEGNIPLDITKKTIEKVQEGIDKTVEDSDSYKVQSTKSDFVLKSNYYLDELLAGGSVLFGDPISAYVNEVADKVLENDTELSNELRFYVLKSNMINAFATHQGMIFITTGLIAKLKTEAQLAYVLAHEITHYKRKHVINSVLEADKALSKKQSKSLSTDDNIRKLSSYSKKLELEADSVGYNYINAAGYNTKSGVDVFDVLQYSDLPMDEVEFNLASLESENFTYDSVFNLAELLAIDTTVDQDDEFASHPNLDKRREQIMGLADKWVGSDYLISEKNFNDVVGLASYESIRLDLKSINFVKAFYNSEILLKDDPESLFLQNAEFKALYGIAMYKTAELYKYLYEDYYEEDAPQKFQGEISSAYYFFDKIDRSTSVMLALKSGWEYYQKTNDPVCLSRIESLVQFATNSDVFEYEDLADYLDKPFTPGGTEASADDSSDTEGMSKYDQLKKLNKEKEYSQTSHSKASVSSYELLRDLPALGELRKIISMNEDVEIDNNLSNDFNIGTDNLVVIAPEYLKIDERKGTKLENSEEGTYDFYSHLEKSANKSNVQMEILAPKTMSDTDVDKYNDLASVNSWYEEHSFHSQLDVDWNFVASELDYTYKLAEKYGTNTFMYTGLINFKAQKPMLGLIAATVLNPYIAPYTIYRAIAPYKYSYYYTLVFDVAKGKFLVEDLKVLDYQTNDADVMSMTYDMLLTMKKGKKNEK